MSAVTVGKIKSSDLWILFEVEFMNETISVAWSHEAGYDYKLPESLWDYQEEFEDGLPQPKVVLS